MSAHRFSDPMHAVPRADALRELGLIQIGPRAEGGGFLGSGTIVTVISPTGARCGLIRRGAQRLTCRMTGAAGDLWLLFPIDGLATISHGRGRERLEAREIAVGAVETAATFSFESGSGLLFLSLPGVASGLTAPRIIRTGGGIAHILAAMLNGVSDTIGQLSPADLRPVEQACARLLPIALGYDMEQPLIGPERIGREAFQRICRVIEQRLGDPRLNLLTLAREQGVSSRYLHKLFERAGERFGHYVRARRLDRCRADLTDPALAGEPVASIGFRWGFTDPAHFSRAFRDRFGVAPRAYRLGGGSA